jgi:hypothetical protein
MKQNTLPLPWQVWEIIVLFSDMLEFSTKKIKSYIKEFVKKNIDYLRIFCMLNWKFQNHLIIRQTCVGAANVLWVLWYL